MDVVRGHRDVCTKERKHFKRPQIRVLHLFIGYNRKAFSSSSCWKVDYHYETLGVSRDATPEAIKVCLEALTVHQSRALIKNLGRLL